MQTQTNDDLTKEKAHATHVLGNSARVESNVLVCQSHVGHIREKVISKVHVFANRKIIIRMVIQKLEIVED